MIDLWFKVTLKTILFMIWLSVAEYLWEEIIIHREADNDEESQIIAVTFSFEDCSEKLFKSRQD